MRKRIKRDELGRTLQERSRTFKNTKEQRKNTLRDLEKMPLFLGNLEYSDTSNEVGKASIYSWTPLDPTVYTILHRRLWYNLIHLQSIILGIFPPNYGKNLLCSHKVFTHLGWISLSLDRANVGGLRKPSIALGITWAGHITPCDANVLDPNLRVVTMGT